MRKLRFIVDSNTIKKDPSCDFSGLFPGKNPSVTAEFSFSDEWSDAIKVAAFWSMLDSEYDPQVLENNSCVIPPEALARSSFKIQVIGKKTKQMYDQTRLSTDKLTIRQTGDKR